MDINQHLQPVIENLIDNLKVSIEAELKSKVTDEVVNKIAGAEINSLVEEQIEKKLTEKINAFDYETVTKKELDKLVSHMVSQVNHGLASAANQQIVNEINKRIAAFNLTDIINQIVESKINSLMHTGKFPERSIPHTSVNFDGITLTGDNIKGGIVENFGSTGIEDLTTHVQMTLMDHATAFEGPLWAPEVHVKGKLTIDGDLEIKGDIPTQSPAFIHLVGNATREIMTNLNDEFFRGFSKVMAEEIKSNGIDLDTISQAGKEVVRGNQLGYHITDTNIQRLGIVRDLQTSGEALLSETLYTTSRRVGINTIDPSAALTVWDEEVEITTSKRKQDVGYIGTPRRQRLVLGSNSKENIVLDVDGNVQTENLTIGKVNFTSAPECPNYEGISGQIVLNEQPNLSGPIGWVCLGGTRWAKFGKIE